MSDMTMLRIWILVAGVVLVAAIIFFGRPKKPGQGRRVARESGRVEPTLGEQLEAELDREEGEAEPMQEALFANVRAPMKGRVDFILADRDDAFWARGAAALMLHQLYRSPLLVKARQTSSARGQTQEA